jgi:hypothetical protein
MSQMRLKLLLMVVTVDMVSSRATLRLGRIRGTTELSQCGCIEMMSSTTDIEARIKVCTPPVCNVELSFVSS